MKFAAWILGGLAALTAFRTHQNAASAIHQIYGSIGYLTAAVLFGIGAIIGRIDRLAKTVEDSSDLQLQWFMDAYKRLYLEPQRSADISPNDGIPFKDAMRRE
jgi:hypothetical protein